MTELQTDFGRRMAMHELDDAPPGIALCLIPQTGTAGGNARFGRHAGHLGVHQTGAARRPVSVMNQMPIIGYPILRAILRHRRDHHAIRQFHAAQLERQEHGRRCALRSSMRGQPALVGFNEGRIAQLQIVVANALAAGQQAVGKLFRGQVRVPRHILEPIHPVARGALQLEHFDVAFLLIRAERGVPIRRRRHVAGQGNGVFHGKLGAGADREVRCVGGVADENGVAVMPAPASHMIEIEPR